MLIVAPAFLAGIVAVQRSAALDGLVAAAGLGLVVALGLRLASRRGWELERPAARWSGLALVALAALAAGVGWAAWRAELRLADELAGTLEGVELQVRGRVAGLPRASGPGWRFEFEIEPASPGVPRNVQLAWRPERADPRSDAGAALAMPRPGERWQFTVRL